MKKPPITHDDEKTIKQLDQELRELVKKPDFLVQISPIAAWCLIVQIQLAARHPFNKSWMFDHVKNLAHQMISELELSDWLKKYTNNGWNPELDRAVDPTVMAVAIPAHDYVLNQLALGVACQMLVENNGHSLKEVTETIQQIAYEQLCHLTPDQIADAIAEVKKVEP